MQIRYYKPYKNREQLIKENRERPVGRFRSDEEIVVAITLLQKSLKKKKAVIDVAGAVRDIEWNNIVTQLNKKGIKWQKMVSMNDINPKKLKISIVKGSPLVAGKDNKLVFKAEYPGEVENLVAVLDTEISYLGNLEVLFGSFKNSVEREVVVTLPDSMKWQDTDVVLNVGRNDVIPILTKKKVRMVILPKKVPEVVYNYRIVEKSGNINGVLEQNEEVSVVVDVTNRGKGTITKGRLLLINTNNNKQVFIQKGSEAIVLKPGAKTTKTFTVRIDKQDKKTPVILAVSLYDYKIRYSADFTLSFSKNGDNSCVFKKFKKPEDVVLGAGTTLFASAVSRSPLAKTEKDGLTQLDGICGERGRTVDGYWIAPQKSKGGTKTPFTVKTDYAIHMPQVKIDGRPITVHKDNLNLAIEATADTLLDIIVFVNGAKVYYKSFKNQQQTHFKTTVAIDLDQEYNTVKVVARDRDKQRVVTKTKTIYYPPN